MYLEKSRTTATLQHCPASEVPPPRQSKRSAEFAAEGDGGEDVVGVAGKNDADRDLAVVGAVGGVEGAAAVVEANVSCRPPLTAERRASASPAASSCEEVVGAESAVRCMSPFIWERVSQPPGDRNLQPLRAEGSQRAHCRHSGRTTSVGRRQLLAYVGDLEFGAVAVGFDVDGDHVFLIVGDDGAAILVGTW